MVGGCGDVVLCLICVGAQGVGKARATVQAVMQMPCAELHPRMAAGTPRPPVETPAMPPAAVTHATQTTLQPV